MEANGEWLLQQCRIVGGFVFSVFSSVQPCCFYVCFQRRGIQMPWCCCLGSSHLTFFFPLHSLISPTYVCSYRNTRTCPRAHTHPYPHPILFFLRFLCEPFFKVFIESITTLLLFYVLDFWPQGMWALSSPIRTWLTHCAM